MKQNPHFFYAQSLWWKNLNENDSMKNSFWVNPPSKSGIKTYFKN